MIIGALKHILIKNFFHLKHQIIALYSLSERNYYEKLLKHNKHDQT